MNKKDALDVSISAGLGAGFSILLYLSAEHFRGLPWNEQLVEGLVMTLVAVAAVKFIEPLVGQMRVALHISEEHRDSALKKTLVFRAVTFGLLVVTSLAHGLLHLEFTRQAAGDRLHTALFFMFEGLLIPGGITYCWSRGTSWRPSRAARYGLLAGLLLSSGLKGTDAVLFLAENGFSWWSRGEFVDRWIVFSSMWSVCGCFGGLALDKDWTARPSRGAALGVTVGFLLWVGLIIPYFHYFHLHVIGGVGGGRVIREVGTGPDFADTVWGVVVATGWVLGVIAHPKSDEVFGFRHTKGF